ncbi:MFS transporter [Acuticoccus mangrovi]|uniref:MFS transporter n=1 Tax=Acuticoccus mangrovi TaxID=2796142 RepID=A0A934ISK5_9HYPH|nr:MFS transporter [Acuticoccus mangrovi]
MLVTDANRKWWLASGVGAGSGLVLLDESIVGVSLPAMADELSMSLATSHWAVSIYLLTFASFAAASGRLADLHGRRRIFLLGLACFALASLVAGASETAAMLLAARAMQGISAAILFPVGLAITTAAFPAGERGAALGFVAAIGTVMFSLGPLLGGVITSLVSWRLIFYVNIPLAALTAAAVLILAKPTPRRDGPAVDLVGLVLLVSGIVLVSLVLMEGSDWGWTSPLALAVLAAGVALLAALVEVERHKRAPLVDVELLSGPTVAGATLMFFTAQLTKIVVVVFVPIYLQSAVGMSSVGAGVFMLAAVVGSPLMASRAGRSADRGGSRRPALLGLLLTTVGTLGMACALTFHNSALLLAALLLWGFALQHNFVPAAHAVMHAVSTDRQGEASGIVVTARLLGGVFGMTGASALYSAVGRYDAVFYATAVFMLAVLVIGYATIERKGVPTARP